MIKVTNDPMPRLVVVWKGVTVFNSNLPSGTMPLPAGSRIILAGRTGTGNQNVHADNINLFTSQTIVSASGQTNGFQFTLADYSGCGMFDRVTRVLLDTNSPGGGTNVTPYTAITYVTNSQVQYIYGNYTQPSGFPGGAIHSLTIVWTMAPHALHISQVP
jgi:hypothetical protein